MRRTLFLALLCVFACAPHADAASMSPISDLITTSQPSTAASHIIIFKVTNTVPASGSITVTPEGAFSIPGGFGENDVDMAVSNGGPYTERDLAGSANASFDGVSVVSGAAGSVTITLNSTDPIVGGSLVRIVLGTAASYQTAGSVSPINPATPGSYRIQVRTDNGGTPIDFAKAMIAVVLPVTTTLDIPYLAPIISNAYPSGTLPAGSNNVELSLETNKPSTCRYATSSGMTYASMTNTFNSIGNVLFYKVVSGHQDGQSYTYYVRCSDLGGLVNLSDYPITFSLAATPDVLTSDGTTPTGGPSGGGSGGSGGTGPFAGGSALLFLSNVTISGKAPPGTSVTMLRDGKIELTTQVGSNGAFSGKISGLERGTYTFVIYAADGKGNKTSRFSSTLTLGSGTNNAISNVLLSPTVTIEKDTVDVGQPVIVSGLGVPASTVGIIVRDVPKKGGLGVAKEYAASSTEAGTWTFTVPAKDIARGTYDVRVKTIMPEASSEYSAPLYVGYGESPSQKADTGNRSDINKDGKVNLVDFSILLTHWNEDDADADINEDGIVNLSDFSILLFNWTG